MKKASIDISQHDMNTCICACMCACLKTEVRKSGALKRETLVVCDVPVKNVKLAEGHCILGEEMSSIHCEHVSK